MTSITYKVGDRLPILTATLMDANGVVDISDVQHVYMTMRRRNSEELFLQQEADVIDGEGGRVQYAWQDGDLNKSGEFQVEWVATWPSGESMTFPNATYGEIIVLSRLG